MTIEGSRSEWRSLRSRFFSSGLIVMATIVLVLMLFLPFITFELDEQIAQLERDLRNNIHQEGQTIARLFVYELSRFQDLVDILSIPRGSPRFDSYRINIGYSLWEKVVFNKIINDIQLLDDTGTIQLTPHALGGDEASKKMELGRFLDITTPVHLSEPGEDRVYMPLYIDGNRWGIVGIAISTAEIEDQIRLQLLRQQQFRTLIIWLFILALMISASVGIWVFNILSRKITEPIMSLARNTESFARHGDTSKLESVPAENDEVGMLAKSFDRMAREINLLLKEKDDAYEQLKQSKQQLRQSEKLATLGELSGGVAHEINNALSPIRLRAEEMLLSAEDGETADPDDLRVIIKGIDQCSTIVQKLRNFAAPSLGRKTEADLNELLRETSTLVKRQLESHKIQMNVDFQPIPKMRINANEIQQVFMNIFLNAKDAIVATGRSTGTITVRTRREGNDALVEIEDDGIGMDEEARVRIFEPFYTTKEVGKGTGLGMSISFGILKSHGGSIEIESTPGSGTCIKIFLPWNGVSESDEVYQ
jgi:signal transduction histidine kinase